MKIYDESYFIIVFSIYQEDIPVIFSSVFALDFYPKAK